MSLSPHDGLEWLEPDGLGGFAPGTASGIRTRRYHALLTSAATPPTRRQVLVAGMEVTVGHEGTTVALSSQRYAPGVVHPDGVTRLQAFANEPWPAWRYRIASSLVVEQSLFVPKGLSLTVLRWRVQDGRFEGCLRVRPLLAGRDYHSVQLLTHLTGAGLGHLPEVADGDAPHHPGGCPFQAWSVGEAVRLDRLVLSTDRAAVPTTPGQLAGIESWQ